MDGSSFGNLRLYPAVAQPAPADDTPRPFLVTRPPLDPHALANRELVRPPGYRRGHRQLEPYSAAWFDELEQKRYARHGAWLPAALEFGRHPGESVLVIGPGVGCDAVTYLRTGSEVTLAVGPDDQPDLIRDNLARHGLTARAVTLNGPRVPASDGAFDVVAWNALHDAAGDRPARVEELYRVLKPGGKVIGLFPARYDAGFWQDVLLPLQWLYWRRPADPTTGPRTTARELRRAFARFGEHRVFKRHLRRGELPHPWRTMPLTLLERLIGRVLVLKALKPLSAARAGSVPAAEAWAA